jgi:hypothetical protein
MDEDLPRAFQTAEHLVYPSSIVRRISDELERTNGLYPESQREMMGMRVSFLERVR